MTAHRLPKLNKIRAVIDCAYSVLQFFDFDVPHFIVWRSE